MAPRAQEPYETEYMAASGPVGEGGAAARGPGRKKWLIPLTVVALLAGAGGITAWQLTKHRSTTSSDGAFASIRDAEVRLAMHSSSSAERGCTI